MFRSYETWRHRNCLDMDLWIIKRTYSNSEYVKLRVRYSSRKGYFYDNGPSIVKVYRKDFKNWHPVKPDGTTDKWRD